MSLVSGSLGCRPNEDRGASDRESGSSQIVGPSSDVRWTSPLDDSVRRKLRSGDVRLAVIVSAFEPPTTGSAVLVVRLLNAEGTVRKEIDRFSVHPESPFRAGPGVEPHRFLFSLGGGESLLKAPELRVEVGFAFRPPEIVGGRAEISCELVDPVTGRAFR